MAAPLNGLRQALDRRDTVIFVGSGVSCWSGLPAWKALLERLAEFMEGRGLSPQLVTREIQNGDLLQAASYGFYQLSTGERAEFLRHACKVDSSEPSELHEVITTLGPRSFITTNYDKLLERALNKWCPEHHFQVVGNWDVVDVANVTQAASTDFIFKPHGDIDSSESIILTREDYRSLHGKRRFVFESLKTLLATRPVVFIGFGLRDPDFLLMKDLLAETYPGGLSDHYAVVADIESDEVQYWRQTYGMHLIGYRTCADRPDRHFPLLELLRSVRSLAPATTAETAVPDADMHPGDYLQEPDVVLRLVRHCARMQMLEPAKPNDEIPLRLRFSNLRWDYDTVKFLRFNGGPAADVLLRLDEHVLLIAPPGAGKTFTLRSATSSAAFEAQTALLEDSESPRVPVYVELKSYAGDLWELVQSMLPVGLDLEALIRGDQIRLLLDGANEVENRYMESDIFGTDLTQFIQRIGATPLILASRSDIGLGQKQFVRCILDEVDIQYVEKLFHTENLAVMRLLQKPLFLRLAQSASATANIGPTPHSLYLAYFDAMRSEFEREFSISVDFVPILAGVAFELIDDGRQTFMAASIVQSIEEAIGRDLSAKTVVNWLIERELLMPLPGAKLSFAHHTISEYLAAYELARVCATSKHVVRRCLSRRSWDVAILLALGFLPSEDADRLYAQILHTDPSAAVRALDYIESGRANLVSSCLSYVADLDDLSFEDVRTLGWSLEHLRPEPDCPACVEALWKICRKGDLLGGAAANVLVRSNLTDVDAVAASLIGLALEFHDYNFSSSVGKAIQSRVSKEAIKAFLDQANAIEVPADIVDRRRLGYAEERFIAIVVLGEWLMKGFSVAEISEMVSSLTGAHNVVVDDIVLSTVDEDGSLEALRITAHFVEQGDMSAVYHLFSQVRYRSPAAEDIGLIYSSALVEGIYRAIRGDSDANGWALCLLSDVCSISDVWKNGVEVEKFTGSPLQEIVVSYAVGRNESSGARLREWADANAPTPADARLLDAGFEPWVGYEDALLALLKTRNAEVATTLLVPRHPFSRIDVSLGVKDIDWWIDWLSEPQPVEMSLLRDRLGEFIADHMDSETAIYVKDRFNNGNSRLREALSESVLNRDGLVQFDDLGADSISWLVADLERRPISPWGNHLLSVVATEEFVESVLIPLMSDSPSDLLKVNLRQVLRECGRRHGRRYLSIEDKVVG